MKQPFWILNSILLLIFFGSLIFIFNSSVKIPRRQSIQTFEIPLEKKEDEKVDYNIIYKNDLFNTVPTQQAIETKVSEDAIPKPPEPVEAKIPEVPVPQFLDPLDITLTGIIIQEDETKNKAIILDNKTKNQINYKVNDELEDAQIIRILKNKVILIRSNGQQEILYLREVDLKEDNLIERSIEAKNYIKKLNENFYILDPVKFVSYIRNLSEFLEVFDLSTAYKQGEAIGSKLVKLEQDSIASNMGLQQGDIIEKVNDIAANNNENRYEIYQKIISLKEGDIIKVEILRNNLPFTINYKLKNIDRIKIGNAEGKTELIKIEEDRIENNKIRIMKEKYQFAPTIEQIAQREKESLFKKKK